MTSPRFKTHPILHNGSRCPPAVSSLRQLAAERLFRLDISTGLWYHEGATGAWLPSRYHGGRPSLRGAGGATLFSFVFDSRAFCAASSGVFAVPSIRSWHGLRKRVRHSRIRVFLPFLFLLQSAPATLQAKKAPLVEKTNGAFLCDIQIPNGTAD